MTLLAAHARRRDDRWKRWSIPDRCASCSWLEPAPCRRHDAHARKHLDRLPQRHQCSSRRSDPVSERGDVQRHAAVPSRVGARDRGCWRLRSSARKLMGARSSISAKASGTMATGVTNAFSVASGCLTAFWIWTLFHIEKRRLWRVELRRSVAPTSVAAPTWAASSFSVSAWRTHLTGLQG